MIRAIARVAGNIVFGFIVAAGLVGVLRDCLALLDQVLR